VSEVFTQIDGGALDLLIIADHASAHVPADIDLGIDAALLTNHIAIDIGVAEVSRLLAEQLGCTAILGGVSRLVIDLNREDDAPGLLPVMSDGHVIPGQSSGRPSRADDPLSPSLSPSDRAVAGRHDVTFHPVGPQLHAQSGE
jgi:predicted N-formylglutamate amidohydrolase